jgi:hypothetical protein
MKNKLYHANSIAEAIADLEDFLESDLYTLFRPEIKIPAMKGSKKKVETFYRKDTFKNEGEFIDYLRNHFKILGKKIIRGIGKKKFNAKFKKKRRNNELV